LIEKTNHELLKSPSNEVKKVTPRILENLREW